MISQNLLTRINTYFKYTEQMCLEDAVKYLGQLGFYGAELVDNNRQNNNGKVIKLPYNDVLLNSLPIKQAFIPYTIYYYRHLDANVYLTVQKNSMMDFITNSDITHESGLYFKVEKTICDITGEETTCLMIDCDAGRIFISAKLLILLFAKAQGGNNE